MISKDEMELELNNKGYDVLDIDVFLIEHFENLKSIKYNLKKFLEIFGDNYVYSQMTIKELTEELKRMNESRDKGEDAFSDEIFEIEYELNERFKNLIHNFLKEKGFKRHSINYEYNYFRDEFGNEYYVNCGRVE